MKWLFCIFMPKFSWIKELHFKVIPSLFHDIYFNFMRVSCLVSWTFRRSILNDTLISSRKIERILKCFNKRSRSLVFKVRHLSAWIINEWMNEMKCKWMNYQVIFDEWHTRAIHSIFSEINSLVSVSQSREVELAKGMELGKPTREKMLKNESTAKSVNNIINFDKQFHCGFTYMHARLSTSL